MLTFVRGLCWVLMLVLLPAWPLFWLSCRLTAQRRPACGSKWATELIGEWDGEDWLCHGCGHSWVHKE